MDQLLSWRRRQKNLTQRLVHDESFQPPESKMPNAIKPRMGESMRDILLDTDNSLSALLCVLWREEETRLGVMRDSDGCISCKSIKYFIFSIFHHQVHSFIFSISLLVHSTIIIFFGIKKYIII
jgi:hypothetical protein